MNAQMLTEMQQCTEVQNSQELGTEASHTKIDPDVFRIAASHLLNFNNESTLTEIAHSLSLEHSDAAGV